MNFKLQCHSYAIVIIILTIMTMPVFAQSNTSLKSIITKAKKATLSTQAYDVQMAQDIHFSSSKVKTKSITSEKFSKYQIKYHPGKGVDMKRIASSSKAIKGTKTTASSAKPTMQIYVDLNKLYKSSSAWKNYKIDNANLNNKPCYKISAEYKKFEFTIWIDRSNYYVPKVVLDIDHAKFSETNIQYKNINNVWLPTHITILHSNGTLVNQTFNSYSF